MERTLTLPDGRRLGLSEYGDPLGAPVLYFHGTPGCRLEPRDFGHDAAQRAGVRLIVLERPGYGLSSPLPGRRILDWPDDVECAANQLGLERFWVLGYSGGCPFALATAWKLGDRVRGVTICEGLGPLEGAGALAEIPWYHPQRLMLGAGGLLLRPIFWALVFAGRRDPDFLFSRMPSVDRRIAEREQVRASFRESLLGEAVVQGLAAPVLELSATLRPWGFALEEIRTPVRIFQGEQDTNCTPSMARTMSSRIPGAELIMLPEAGHLIVWDLMEQFLRATLRGGAGADTSATGTSAQALG